MIRNWFVGGPLHGMENRNTEAEVHYRHIAQPDPDEWLSYSDLNAPIQALPVTVHTYYRRQIQFQGYEGNVWIHRDLDPRDLLPLVSALMGDVRHMTIREYASDGWLSGSSWASSNVSREMIGVENGQHVVYEARTTDYINATIYGHSAVGQVGSPEAMAALWQQRIRRTREDAQTEWERRTRARQNGEQPNLFLDDELFEQTVTGLTHNMTWSPGDPDDPDANRSHP